MAHNKSSINANYSYLLLVIPFGEQHFSLIIALCHIHSDITVIHARRTSLLTHWEHLKARATWHALFTPVDSAATGEGMEAVPTFSTSLPPILCPVGAHSTFLLFPTYWAHNHTHLDLRFKTKDVASAQPQAMLSSSTSDSNSGSNWDKFKHKGM